MTPSRYTRCMSKPSLARYRTTNWSSYNASLRKRGSLLIWVDKDMIWRAPRDGRLVSQVARVYEIIGWPVRARS